MPLPKFSKFRISRSSTYEIVIRYHLLHFPVFIIFKRIDTVVFMKRIVEESKKKRVLNVVTSRETLGKTSYLADLWVSDYILIHLIGWLC
jgi:hypothetical protein